jgi:hypothetical protein
MGALWKHRIGLSIIPAAFAVTQWWLSYGIILQLPPHRIYDGIHYLAQGRLLHAPGLRSWMYHLLVYGLYPLFLSFFHIPELDGAIAGNDPRLLFVYKIQAMLLAAGTAAFLFCTIALSSGALLKRITITTLLGAMLLSPLVIVWPSGVVMEALTLAVLLLVLSACIAFDVGAKHSLVLIGLSSGLLIWIRDPLIPFICLFLVLLVINVTVSSWTERRTVDVVAVAILLAAVVFGATRAELIERLPNHKYVEPLADLVQLRILPNPERTTFFVEHGLPVSPIVMQRSGQPAPYQNTLFLPDSEIPPEFSAYRNWLIKDGFFIYFEFLLTHPN